MVKRRFRPARRTPDKEQLEIWRYHREHLNEQLAAAPFSPWVNKQIDEINDAEARYYAEIAAYNARIDADAAQADEEEAASTASSTKSDEKVAAGVTMPVNGKGKARAVETAADTRQRQQDAAKDDGKVYGPDGKELPTYGS